MIAPSVFRAYPDFPVLSGHIRIFQSFRFFEVFLSFLNFSKCIFTFLFCRAKKPQPDNFEGSAAGKLIKVSDPIGLTVEGLQEWHDEACMAVLNNHYNDGVKWHDVACHMRSKIVCEDSDALIQRALRENPGNVLPEPVPVKN